LAVIVGSDCQSYTCLSALACYCYRTF